MGLIKDLIAAARGLDAPVREIVAGPRHFMVTATGSGVAVNRGPSPTHPALADPEAFGAAYEQRALADLAALAVSCDSIEAALGVAALNSALAGGRTEVKPRSLAIPRAGGKTVAVIGEFAFIEDLKRVAARVITLTAGAGPAGNAASGAPAGADSEAASGAASGAPTGPASEVASGASLDQADIAIIAGATIVDGSLEAWLERTRNSYTVVYGPSTPLSPVLFAYGADQLVGVRITTKDVAARWIREGREDLLACPGISTVVIAREREAHPR